MQPQRVVNAQPLSGPGHRARLTAIALFASAIFGQSALAATDSFFDCDQLASELRSLEVPANVLPLETVDHVPVDDSDQLSASLESDLNHADAVAPILLLTPRVATIMRKVFDTNLLDDESVADKEHNTQLQKKRPTASSPPLVSAPAAPAANNSLTGERSTDSSNNPYVPRFQRQMYRTDI
ncbi:MAG: hypothetical protein RIA65_05260 [Woeseia sp.]